MPNGGAFVPAAAGNANPGGQFRYDSSLGAGGGYIFNLKTRGLPSGTYALTIAVGGDPVHHGTEVLFQIR